MAERASTHAVFAARVDKLDDQALRQAAKDVVALIESPGWVFVQQLLGDLEDQTIEKVIHRRMSIEDYDAETALVSGIRQAREVTQTVLYVAQRREVRIEQLAALAAEEA